MGVNADRPALHRVLVVDDDHAIRSIFSIALERENVQTDVAESGREAVELLRRHGNAYCGVVLDLEIPPPTGIEIAKLVSNDLPGVPVIVVSGRPDLVDRLRQMEIAPVVKMIMFKPVDPGSLAEYVHGECMRRAQN